MVALQQDLATAAAAHQFVAEIFKARAAGIGAEEERGGEKKSCKLRCPQPLASPLKGRGFGRAESAATNCHSEQARAELAKRARREESAVLNPLQEMQIPRLHSLTTVRSRIARDDNSLRHIAARLKPRPFKTRRSHQSPASAAAAAGACAGCLKLTAVAFGTSATSVPKITTYTPSHSHITSGFRWARIIGGPFSSLRPA